MKRFITACMCIALAASAGFSQTKISCGKTATCSASPKQAASKAVDCNTGTRWESAFSDPQWIYIDLGASTPISRIVLRWEPANAKNYTLDIAENSAGPWTTIKTCTNMAAGTRTDDWAVSVTARFVRMTGTVRNLTYGYSLWEFEIYSPSSCVPPSIPSNQPADVTVNVGQTATFSVTASGTTPLSYQWYKQPDGGTRASISGATASSYTTPATTAGDNNSKFDVVVTNACGSPTSRQALLTVNTPGAPPTIPSDQPADQTVNVGQPATFTVTASGTLPFTYQWYKTPNGGVRAAISGATSSSYTTPATTAADNNAKFDVYVSNNYGNATSRSANLTVITPTTCTWTCNSEDMIWPNRAVLIGANCKTPGDPGLTLGGWFYNLRGDADGDGQMEMMDMTPGSATVTNASGTTTITGGAVAAKTVNAENVTTTGSLNAVDATVTGTLNAGSAMVSGSLSAAGASLDQLYVAGSARVNGDLLAGGTATLANVDVTSSLNAGSAVVTGNLNAGSAEIAGNLNAGYTTVANITVSGPEITTYMSPDGFTSSNFGGSTYIRGNVIETNTINGIQLSQYGFNVGRTRINPEDIRTTQVYTTTLKITQSPWSDFVFAKEYNLMPLDKIEKFIKQYGHLPDMPSEAEVKKDGVDVGEVQAKLLQKVEELTLHAIALEKKVESLSEENSRLERRIEQMGSK